MNFFDIYPLLLGVIFVFLVGWLLPGAGGTYDLFRLKLQLYPFWFKYAAVAWFLAAVVLVIFVFSGAKPGDFVAVNLNFALFVFLFSKEKYEDEFTEQLRLKSFVYAFILFVPFLILFGSLKASGLAVPKFFLQFIFVQFYLGIAMLSAVVYFYVTKYKSNKKAEV